jgi:hypothetical protein
MNRAAAQAKLYAGYGKIGTDLGVLTTVYRPTTANNPITPLNVADDILVRFDPKPDFSTVLVNTFAKPVWYGGFNATNNIEGDIFITEDGAIYYLASLQSLVPPMMVRCNKTVDFYRPAKDYQSPYKYSGNTANAGKGAPLALQWPISMLQGTKGEKSQLNLPEDTRQPWYSCLIPVIPNVSFKTNDVLFDENDDRYILSSIELTELGYRCTATYSEA